MIISDSCWNKNCELDLIVKTPDFFMVLAAFPSYNFSAVTQGCLETNVGLSLAHYEASGIYQDPIAKPNCKSAKQAANFWIRFLSLSHFLCLSF